MNKDELVELLDNSSVSREKTFVLFLCAAKSLPVLTEPDCPKELDDLREVLETVQHLTFTWISCLREERVTSCEFLELFTESKLLRVLVRLHFDSSTDSDSTLNCLFGQIEQILDALFEHVDIAAHSSTLFYPYLAVLTRRFVQNRHADQLTLCSLLERVLRANLSSSQSVPAVRQNIAQIACIIGDLLASRLNSEWRNAALALAATITGAYGDLRWLNFRSDQKTVNAKKLFLVLGSLVPIEVRLAIDRQQVTDQELGHFLILFEAIFLKLAQSEDDSQSDELITSLNHEELFALLQRIKSTISTIVEFVCEHIEPLSDDDDGSNDKKAPLACNPDSVALETSNEKQKFSPDTLTGCVRTLCLYLSEENELLAGQHVQIVRRLLTVLRFCSNSQQPLDLQMSQIVLSALHSLTVNSDSVRNLLCLHRPLLDSLPRKCAENQQSLSPILRDLQALLSD
jgi:hypothetical protein